MKFQKLIFPVLFISFIGVLVWGCGQGEKSEQAVQEKSSVERTSEVTLSAIVEAVDYDARILTLKDEVGNTQTLNVKNPKIPLEKLEAGDPVTMTIYQKEVNYVAAVGEEIPADEEFTTVGAKKGEEEKTITVVNAQNMTTTVKEIDLANRLVTLVQADGTPLTLPVQDDVKNLDKLEIGDQVVTRVTQIISVSIDK